VARKYLIDLDHDHREIFSQLKKKKSKTVPAETRRDRKKIDRRARQIKVVKRTRELREI
jgi:hypothetical protein